MLCSVSSAVGDDDTMMIGKLRDFLFPGLPGVDADVAEEAEPFPPFAAVLSWTTKSLI